MKAHNYKGLLQLNGLIYNLLTIFIQGSVLSIFFWGYSFTQVLGGWLSDTYSSQIVLVYSCFAWIVLTFITPIIVNPDYAFFMSPTSALLLLRFLFGALQGNILFSIQTVTSVGSGWQRKTSIKGFTHYLSDKKDFNILSKLGPSFIS